MKKYKIVFKGKTKKGDDIIIRDLKITDAKAMCEYINKLSSERSFIRRQGEIMTLKEETKYVKSQLQKIKQKKAVLLLVFCNKKLIGNSQINMKSLTSAHIGDFGISINKEYRSIGVGRLLMDSVIKEAKNRVPVLKTITFTLFASNAIAFKMYKSFGFKEYGRLPRGLKLKDKYIDEISMYKQIRK